MSGDRDNLIDGNHRLTRLGAEQEKTWRIIKDWERQGLIEMFADGSFVVTDAGRAAGLED